MSKAWEGGSSASWRKLRKQILDRDGHKCRLRIEGICTDRATCVHHTVGKGVTGDDPRYLVASCRLRECNLHIGNPERYDPEPEHRTSW